MKLLSSKTSSRLGESVCLLLIIACYLAVGLPRYRLGLDWSDEGFLAYGAERVTEGQVPNRDFVSLQPPLSFYIVAAAFKLMGTSLLTLRKLGLCFYLLLGILIYGFARNFMNRIFATAAALPMSVLGMPYFAFVPFAVWQGITASLGALLLYVSAAFSRRRWLAAGAGIVTAIALALRHEQAVYLILSIVIFTVAVGFGTGSPLPAARLKSTFVVWLGALIATSIMFLVVWWAQGAIPGMFRQLVLFPLTTYAKTSSLPFPRFDPHTSAAQNALNLLCYVPPVVVVCAAVWIIWQIARRRFGFREAICTFLAASTALFYLQILTRSDLHHFLPTLPPFLVFAAYCCSLMVDRLSATWRKGVVSAVSAVAVAAYLFTVGPVVMGDPTSPVQSFEVRRGGLRLPDARWLGDFIGGIQAHVPAERSILALPYQPMFYFLCERRNPTHWNYIWPGDQTTRDHEELVAQCRRDPPAVVFITGESTMAGYAPLILDYVHADYKRAGNFGGISVYFPRREITR